MTIVVRFGYVPFQQKLEAGWNGLRSTVIFSDAFASLSVVLTGE
jgi:hypothetical protein